MRLAKAARRYVAETMMDVICAPMSERTGWLAALG
jgi:hypothetical protein